MYRKILVATDGSPIAKRAAETALALARQLGADLHVAYVIDTRTLVGATPPVPDSLAPRYGALLEALREIGDAAVGAVRDAGRAAGVAVETSVITGTPAAGILDAASKAGADLVVMGTHGRSAVGSLVLGSTAFAVLHGASGPVLLVR